MTATLPGSVEDNGSNPENLHGHDDSLDDDNNENEDPMRFKRFRLKDQTRDDNDTVPMLRREGEGNLCAFEENGEAVKKFYESIILEDHSEESVEICVSDSSSFSVPVLSSQSLSSSDSPPREEQDETESRRKSVSFSEPMVTSSWDIPKIEAEDVEKMFYTSDDIKKFRLDRNGCDMSKIRDKEYVDRLVQNLDRMGADSFARGEYNQALEAFKHSLRVKTDTFSEYDNIRSTSATIHCIADVYSKMSKWNRALDTYRAALELLSRLQTAEKDEDARRWAMVLCHKITTVQGYLDVVQTPSRDSI